MIDWMFILFFFLGILFLLVSILMEDNPFWNLMSITVSCVIWLILALSNMAIEIPYQYVNATSGAAETGVHTYASPISPYLVYFFLLMFILNFIYLLAMIWDKWFNYKNWHGGF